MQKCDKCSEDTYIIYITTDHGKLCSDCHNKKIKKIIRRRYIKRYSVRDRR